MTTTRNKDMFTNEAVLVRQWIFFHVTFLSLNNVFVLFDTSSLHANTNLPNRRFFRMRNF